MRVILSILQTYHLDCASYNGNKNYVFSFYDIIFLYTKVNQLLKDELRVFLYIISFF